MLKTSVVFLCFLVVHALAQVTYSDTPSSEDLEQYFFGGMRVLELDVPPGEELRYQVINMNDMGTLWSGSTGNLVNAAPDGFAARFSFAISDFFADWCSIQLSQINPDEVKFEFFQSRLSVVIGEPQELAIDDGSNNCIYFDFRFNWGHWTDILANYQGELSEEGWIPALAFIPNFNIPTGEENTYSGVKPGSAETWLVLLVTFDDLNYGATPNELSQEEVINLLQQYGIDTTP